MGVVYSGPYDGLVERGANGYPHEGYAGQLRPDGSVSPFYIEEFDAYVAACGCHWQGETRYPPTEEGEDQALDEWRRVHLQPLVDKAAGSWPRWADSVGNAARDAAAQIAAGQPARAAEILARLVGDVEHRVRIAEELAEG